MQPDPVSVFLQSVSLTQHARISSFSKYPYVSDPMVQRFLRFDPIGRFLSNEPKGRFMQMAPYGFYTDLNLYSYCVNNPLNYIDPYGLACWGKIGHGVKNISDIITHGVGGGGEAALTGGTSVYSYVTALKSVAEDPWYVATPEYNALRGIASIPASTGIDPIGGSGGVGGSGGHGQAFIPIPPFFPHPGGHNFISIDW